MSPEETKTDSLSPMNIATGLRGFSLLSRITEASRETVAGYADLENAPPYLGIEALAQAGAYHVRFLCGFEKQAVVLLVKSCRLPGEASLSGRCELRGTLRSRSASVFAYDLSANMNGGTVLSGELVFTAVAYNSELREDRLKEYYRKKWADLRNG